MVVAEIKRRIAHCPDFTGIVRIHVDRQVEIRVYPHQMVFNGSSGSSHARQVKIGMIGGTEQGVAVCLRLIIYTEPIVVRQGIHHPYRNIARKNRLLHRHGNAGGEVGFHTVAVLPTPPCENRYHHCAEY